jgi:hypothetical protein
MNSLNNLEKIPPPLLLKDVNVLEEVLHYGAYGELVRAEVLGAPYTARLVGMELNERALKVVDLWSALRHPSFVSLVGLFVEKEMVWMVTEEIDVNLLDLLESYPRSELPLSVKSTVLYDVSCALCYLHSLDPPLPFEDLKADHVFITADLRGKLDLGVKITGSKFHTYLNTFESYDPAVSYHVPPDFINTAFACPKVRENKSDLSETWDAFSFGVLCIHTLIQEVPIPLLESLQSSHTDDEKAYFYTEEERRKEYIAKIEGQEKLFLPLIRSCLSSIPKSRPKLWDVLKDVRHIQQQVSEGNGVLTAMNSYALHEHVESLTAEVKRRETELKQIYSQLSLACKPYPNPVSTSKSSSVEGYYGGRRQDSSDGGFAKDEVTRLSKSWTDPSYYCRRNEPAAPSKSFASSSSGRFTDSFKSQSSVELSFSESTLSCRSDLMLEDSDVFSTSPVKIQLSDRQKGEFVDMKYLSVPRPDIPLAVKSAPIPSNMSSGRKTHSVCMDASESSSFDVPMMSNPAYEPASLPRVTRRVKSDLYSDIDMTPNPSYQPVQLDVDKTDRDAYSYI